MRMVVVKGRGVAKRLVASTMITSPPLWLPDVAAAVESDPLWRDAS